MEYSISDYWFEKIIFDTIDEFNKSQNQFEIEKNKLSLIGGSSPLDSLALVII